MSNIIDSRDSCAERYSEEHLGNFYDKTSEQESEFEAFYKQDNGKIKQRLWLGVFDIEPGETGAQTFQKLVALNLVRWAVGQEEGTPGPRGKYIRVALMTKKQYTLRRARALFRRLTARLRPGAAIRGAVVLASDITRRAPGTDLLEYGDYPRLSNDDDDDDSDDDDEDDGANNDMSKRDLILEEALKFNTTREAMHYIKQKDRLWYISSQKQIRHFIEGEIIDASNRGIYDRAQFNTPTLDLMSPDHLNKAVVLIGPTGMGKTQWALAHFSNPVHIRDKNDYARITDRTDGIVLDDLDQMHWQPLTLLKLVECETNITMNIKYGSKIIPAGMPRFIIANSWELFWPQNFKQESIDAVERRVVSYVIRSKLYGATTDKPTMNKVAQFNFLFVANNIARYVEIGKANRAAKLKELEAEQARETYKHLNLNFIKARPSSSTGRGGTLPGGERDAPGRSLQDDAAVGGAQLPKAVPRSGPGQDVVPLADDGSDGV